MLRSVQASSAPEHVPGHFRLLLAALLVVFAGACDGGGTAAEEYQGQAACRELVQKSGVETASVCPTSTTEPGALVLPGQATCVRDSYVFTAIAYCWRSECFAKLGVTEEDVRAGKTTTSPPREAKAGLEMMEGAMRLCTSSPSSSGPSCSTSTLLACP